MSKKSKKRKAKSRKGAGSSAKRIAMFAGTGNYPASWVKPKPKRKATRPVVLCAHCVSHPSPEQREPRAADPRFYGQLHGKPFPLCEVCWSMIFRSATGMRRHVLLRAEWQPT